MKNKMLIKMLLQVTFGNIYEKSDGYLIRGELIHRLFIEKLQVETFQIVNKSYPNLTNCIITRHFISKVIALIFAPLLLIKQIKKSDSILIEGSMFLCFAFASKLMRKKVIFDPQGAMALLGKRERKSLYNTIARRIIGNTLDYIASHISDVILFVSNDDMAFFVKNYKIEETKAKLVRLVVEVSEPCKKMLKRKNQLVFIGNLNSIQNKTAAEFIIKDLAPNLQEYNFFIIGKGKSRFEHNLNNIHLTGFMEDPKEVICSSSIAIVPLISGTGVKTKILYFLSLGIPVITTQIGAEGLINTKSILNKGLFISDIQNFLENIKKTCEISGQLNPTDLRNYVIENHSTDSMRKDIENIFHEIIS